MLCFSFWFVTFRVSRGRCEMCIGHPCVCLSLAASPYYCMDPDVTWGNGRGAAVVHCWADLQSVHGFCCCDNTALNAKCQRVLVLALCLVYCCFWLHDISRNCEQIFLKFLDGNNCSLAVIIRFLRWFASRNSSNSSVCNVCSSADVWQLHMK